MQKSSDRDRQAIFDRFDDDMDYLSALFDLIRNAGMNSHNFGADTLTIISKSALDRIEDLKNCFNKNFERG
jgi:hypothetical protein